MRLSLCGMVYSSSYTMKLICSLIWPLGAKKRRIAMDPALGDRVSADSLGELISRFGIDSLLEIELRSWLAKKWAAEVPIFEILGDKTVENIGIFAAGKRTLRAAVSI